MTKQEALRALAVERQERMEACQKELDAVLKRYGLGLTVQISVTPDGRLVGQPMLVEPNPPR